MILYNITYNIEKDIESDWLEWIKTVYLPKIMASGYFTSVRLYKLLKVEDVGTTYSIQFMSENLDKIQEFLHEIPKHPRNGIVSHHTRDNIPSFRACESLPRTNGGMPKM